MPELRKDPVVGRWVIMATERGKRPSDFKLNRDQRKGAPCAFCAGMEQMTPPEVLAYRENGSQPNGPGWRVRAVSNKFPALRIEGAAGRRGDGLYDLMNGIGAHEVLIESPDHDRGLADLEQHQIEECCGPTASGWSISKQDERFRYGMIFKNHGAEAGRVAGASALAADRAADRADQRAARSCRGASDLTTRSRTDASSATSSTRRARTDAAWCSKTPNSSRPRPSQRAFPSSCG